MPYCHKNIPKNPTICEAVRWSSHWAADGFRGAEFVPNPRLQLVLEENTINQGVNGWIFWGFYMWKRLEKDNKSWVTGWILEFFECSKEGFGHMWTTIRCYSMRCAWCLCSTWVTMLQVVLRTNFTCMTFGLRFISHIPSHLERVHIWSLQCYWWKKNTMMGTQQQIRRMGWEYKAVLQIPALLKNASEA